MLFDLSLLILSAIAIKWAHNKDKQNERTARVNKQKQTLS